MSSTVFVVVMDVVTNQRVILGVFSNKMDADIYINTSDSKFRDKFYTIGFVLDALVNRNFSNSGIEA